MIHARRELEGLVFGLTQFGDTPPVITPGLDHLIHFLEVRIGQAGELTRRVTDQRSCYVHAPDPEEDAFLEVIHQAAELQSVVAVNAHARPNDHEWLCPGCARRWTAAQATRGPCQHCGEPDAAGWRGTFPFDEACRQLENAATVLQARGKVLLIENTYETPELMERILSSIPNAGFTLDTGHSMLYGTGPGSYLRKLGHRLRHLHLHDNRGGDSERLHDLHLPPGQGIIEWERLATDLQAIPFSGTAVFECTPDAAWVHRWIGGA